MTDTATTTTTYPLQMTGRMWGYTTELDWVERQMKTVLRGKAAAFVVTERKVTGTRGFFNKRFVSKYEYKIHANTRKEAATIYSIVGALVDRIS